MAEKPDTLNKFLVGVQGAMITVLRLPPSRMLYPDDAINLAAWIVALYPNGDGKARFDELYEAILRT